MKNIIKIRVKSKNIKYFLQTLIKLKINILKIEYINANELHLTIELDDYKKLRKYKTVNKIDVIDKKGLISIKENIILHKYLLIFTVFWILVLFLLSQMIFDIKVISTNKEIRNVVLKELEKYNIKKYRFRKKNVNIIEKKILDNNKNYLENIEITRSGTRYIIKLTERKIKQKENSTTFKDIVSSKNAIITKIISAKGERIKNINDYVKKGEVIISKNVTLPNGEVKEVETNAQIYGEVWYTISCQYPYNYKEIKFTGNKKQVLVINFLKKKIYFPSYKEYKTYQNHSKLLVDNKILPINITHEKQYEIKTIEKKYNNKEIINIVKKISKKKLLDKDKTEEVKEIIVISTHNMNSKLEVKLFAKVIENIGVYH